VLQVSIFGAFVLYNMLLIYNKGPSIKDVRSKGGGREGVCANVDDLGRGGRP